jgi:Flp pilus assembly protein TadG
MRTVKHGAIDRSPEGDDGVILVWVAMMLVALVGMGALVIDIGALYVERRELQNGADAAALAVAQDCAEGDCGSGGGAVQAQKYADLNANDGVSAVDPSTPCGVGPGLAACGTGAPSGAAGASGWVRVDTSTMDLDGGNEVSFLLAPVISSLTGKTVTASAVAAWGPMGGGAVVPLVFSLCEWEAMGGDLDAGTFPTDTQAITFHGTNASSVDCPIGPSGLDLPGGFGRVIAPDCEADLTAGEWADVDTGANLAADCDVQSWQNAEVVIAIFDATNGKTGANGAYHIAGFVGFKVVGYRIVASRGGGGVQKFGSCTPDKPSDQYLCGQFKRVSKNGGDFGTGPDFGARIIKMVG